MLNWYEVALSAYYHHIVCISQIKSFWFAGFCRSLVGLHSSVYSHEARDKFSENGVISHAQLASSGSSEHSDNGKIYWVNMKLLSDFLGGATDVAF